MPRQTISTAHLKPAHRSLHRLRIHTHAVRIQVFAGFFALQLQAGARPC